MARQPLGVGLPALGQPPSAKPRRLPVRMPEALMQDVRDALMQADLNPARHVSAWTCQALIALAQDRAAVSYIAEEFLASGSNLPATITLTEKADTALTELTRLFRAHIGSDDDCQARIVRTAILQRLHRERAARAQPMRLEDILPELDGGTE